jgi:hypothetical protein
VYHITELQMGNSRRLVDTAETFAEAKAKVEAMGVSHMEDDPDYPTCADAYLTSGIVLAIQPEGFTL